VKRVLIFGAGSIGNHMANACTKQGLDVFVTDINKKALHMMKKEIFPKRYGAWNKLNKTN
jgi:3-hydroxyacyl-CoA dehydrogenase